MLLRSKMICALASALALTVLIQPAGAIQIRRVVSEAGAVLRLRGDVTAKDYRRLKDILQDRRIVGLEIRSRGGSLEAGFDIARIVRQRELIVYASRECDSVCAFIFFAAGERFLGRGSKIGVHSVSNDRGKEDNETAHLTINLSRLLASGGIPASVIGKIVATPPAKITFLDNRDLAGLNVHRINPFRAIYEAASAARSQAESSTCTCDANPEIDAGQVPGDKSSTTAQARAAAGP
jgi:hypothetical protein